MGLGNPGRLMGFGSTRRASLDEYPVLEDIESTIQQLSYCQTDLAIIGHVARCCLDCGDRVVQAIDKSLFNKKPRQDEQQDDYSESDQRSQQSLKALSSMRIMIRQDVEYIRSRTAMLLSQVQAIKERAQSQTSLVSALHLRIL